MVTPVRLKDLLLVSISFCLVIFFFYFSEMTYLLWFLAFIPIFLAGWVWHRTGAFLIGVVTLTSTSVLIYLESVSNSIEIAIPTLLLQLAIGYTLIFVGSLMVGKISKVADLEKEVIKQVALRDKTTDLFSERYFRLRLEDETKRSERFEMPFSLLLINIDDLAGYRNTFGNFRTDILLRKIARIIERCAREIDICSRYNDGFGIILPNIRAEKAIMVAERIKNSIEREEFEGDEVEPRIKKTISIGLGQYPEDAFDENELLLVSQEVLDEAIERGGNQILFRTPLMKGVTI